eukprot:CAMPEP_0171326588 /NCGR_PEP_ID=MMETSP0816-20121228/117549_1 /TAXON_ID=420281 /ORGANISM="Proboscia inermis, Strain CCAP1064/1" /LENGTH=147 /DNA_ID=CAMNT_0011826097 /DNA_START=546 /DNA_END=989 /DNA_ORIENTATION=+
MRMHFGVPKKIVRNSRFVESVRRLMQHGEEALKPQFVNEMWRGPMVNPRKANAIRKEAMADGTYGTFDVTTGIGWDAAWDRPQKLPSVRPFKGHKRERTREARAQRIEGLMEDMDDKIQDYRDAFVASKPETEGFENMIKNKQAGKK